MKNKLFQERFSGLTFFDYLELSEGIVPTQTKYGTDGSNGKFEHGRNGYSTMIHDGAEVAKDEMEKRGGSIFYIRKRQ